MTDALAAVDDAASSDLGRVLAALGQLGAASGRLEEESCHSRNLQRLLVSTEESERVMTSRRTYGVAMLVPWFVIQGKR